MVTGIQNNLYSKNGQTAPLKQQGSLQVGGFEPPKGRNYPFYPLP
jgi:hypothetical protein